MKLNSQNDNLKERENPESLSLISDLRFILGRRRKISSRKEALMNANFSIGGKFIG